MLNLGLPHLPISLMVTIEEVLEGDEHSEDLFLVHLHAAADSVAAGRGVQSRRLDQIFPPQQQTCALRSTQTLATGERHQIKTHLCVLPKISHGWHVGGAVVETGDAMAFANVDKFLVPDLATEVGGVDEQQHRRLRADRGHEFFPRLYIDDLHTAVAHGMHVTHVVGLLQDYLLFHTCQIGQLFHLITVGAAQNPGGTQRQSGRRPRRNRRRFAAQSRGDALADAVLDVVELDVVSGAVADRRSHLVAHEGS